MKESAKIQARAAIDRLHVALERMASGDSSKEAIAEFRAASDAVDRLALMFAADELDPPADRS